MERDDAATGRPMSRMPVRERGTFFGSMARRATGPASHFQPEDVHGPSAVVDHAAFPWEDDSWKEFPFRRWSCTNCISERSRPKAPLMQPSRAWTIFGISASPPWAHARGAISRYGNWGYDGVYSFAVQNSYGGAGAQAVRQRLSRQGGWRSFSTWSATTSGPGNYLQDFGPYFTDRYKTPWGRAVNLDGPYSDEVRNYFIAAPFTGSRSITSTRSGSTQSTASSISARSIFSGNWEKRCTRGRRTRQAYLRDPRAI